MTIEQKNLNRRLVCAGLVTAALAPLAAPAQPVGWPAKTITFVVPFPAGGPTDVVARTVAQHMAETLGQPVVVENKLGAGGNIAAAAVARAAPDGYTVLVGGATVITSPHLYKLQFDPMKDLAPVAILATTPVFIWVDSRFPAKSLGELLALLKAKPGEFNYSSSAPSTLAHLGSLRLFDSAGVKLTHINYKGSAQALTDFLAGVFPIHFEVGQSLAPLLKSGKVRALALVASKRSPLLPEVPSVAELGFPGIDAQPFVHLMAPTGTPPAIITRLNEHARRALQSQDVRAKLNALSFDVADAVDPAALAVWLRAESAKWGEVIRRYDFRVE